MILYAKDREDTVTPKPMGGVGEIHGLRHITADRRPEGTRFKLVGTMTLKPGSALGFHVHQHDEEIYLILSGQGIFTDTDNSAHLVGPGDLCVTRQGEGHTLANEGDEPLVFVAVVATDKP